MERKEERREPFVEKYSFLYTGAGNGFASAVCLPSSSLCLYLGFVYI